MCLIGSLSFSFILKGKQRKTTFFSVTLFKDIAFARAEQVSALVGRLRCTVMMPNYRGRSSAFGGNLRNRVGVRV